MEALELNPEQEAVVCAPATTRLLVIAPAGSGKTEVLRRRVARLVEEEELLPGSELLVLSFSRAAVGEMRRRLRAERDRASYVRAQTFDSYATRLLTECSSDAAWSTRDYNGRIQAAVDVVRRGAAADFLAPIRHILVDEVQDLVGDRAAFVLSLLSASSCAFTLFGDPAQGIYDFQLEQSRDSMTSGEFLEQVKAVSKGTMQTLTLARNYRARSDEARRALTVGPLLSDAGDRAGIQSAIDAVVSSLHRGNLDVAVPRLRSARSTALLCRRNSEALQLSKKLHSKGVAHRLQAQATDRALAPWLALTFSGYGSVTMPRSIFEQRLSAVDPERRPEVDEAWRALRKVAGATASQLDLERLHNRVLLGDVPDELCELPAASVVVSTVHRAKGLEFDEVFVVNPSEWLHDERNRDSVDLLQEARVAYVALTRSRDRLFCTDSPDTSGMQRSNGSHRWVRRRQRWMTNEIEVRGNDADWMSPACFGDDPAAVGVAQLYIATEVKQGEPLEMRLHQGARGGDARFDILHHDRLVGRSSPYFDSDLQRILLSAKPYPRPPILPDRIEGLRVECVDSVAGDVCVSEECGLGRAALWLRVRPIGLGRLKWGD